MRGFQAMPDFKGKVFMPRRQTAYAAGYDIHAAQDAVIQPREVRVIRTGLTVYMQSDEELQLRSRASLAYNNKVSILNSPASIDADYYGHEIKVLLINHGEEPFNVTRGDVVAHGVFSKFLKVENDVPKENLRERGFNE